MNTDGLINALAADSIRSQPLDRSCGIAMAIGAASTALIFFAAVGPRADIDAAMHTWRFLLKFAITAPLALAAAAAAYRMARPGTWQERRLWVLAIPLVALIMATLLELLSQPKSLWMTKLVGSNSANCMTLIPLLAISPLVCLMAALRQGAPSNPGLSGAIAGLAASAIAATFYALNCFDDSPLFVITWYPLAASLVVIAGYFCGRRFLSW